MELTPRFESALIYALKMHSKQKRKGTQIPYIAHLLAVASLVMEDGGDEDQVIAALLHDAPEDQGGLVTLAEIRAKFGEHVADIVRGCTDSFETPKPPWRERKEAYLMHLPEATPEVRRVSLADKLHNTRSILNDLQRGESIWGRFSGGKTGTLWYYRSLADIFQSTTISPMAAELGRVVARIESFDVQD